MRENSRFGGFRLLAVGLGLVTALAGAAVAEAVDAPVALTPRNYITARTPAYRWRPILYADAYSLQVFRGSTLLLTRTYPGSVCTPAECAVTPPLPLQFAAHSWRVRAREGGVWGPNCLRKDFEVLNGGFDSRFTTEKLGWTVVKGVWSLAQANYLKSGGLAGTSASIVHDYNYPTLDYQVRMRRTGCPGCANRVIIRGTVQPLTPNFHWPDGYMFQYSNDGQVSVFKAVGGVETALFSWTPCDWVAQYGWNLLRVRASGRYLEFSVNGSLVWAGADASLASGVVGIGMYGHVNTDLGADMLLVDRARLGIDLSVAMSAPVALPAAAGGGDVDNAPGR